MDMGELHWFLGFEVKRNRKEHTISIHQMSYIEAMAKKFCLDNSKPIRTPMEPGAVYSKEQCLKTPDKIECMWGVLFQEAVGCILWLTVVSHPDIAFAV